MKITYTLTIRCTPETVWYWLATPERAVKWQTNVGTTAILEKTPDMIGTTYVETVRDGGAEVEMRGVVTDYRANRALAMHLESKYNSVDVSWSLEDMGGSTRLTVRSDVRLKGSLWLLSVVLRPVFKKRLLAQVAGEHAELRRLCEGGQR